MYESLLRYKGYKTQVKMEDMSVSSALKKFKQDIKHFDSPTLSHNVQRNQCTKIYKTSQYSCGSGEDNIKVRVSYGNKSSGKRNLESNENQKSPKRIQINR